MWVRNRYRFFCQRTSIKSWRKSKVVSVRTSSWPKGYPFDQPTSVKSWHKSKNCIKILCPHILVVEELIIFLCVGRSHEPILVETFKRAYYRLKLSLNFWQKTIFLHNMDAVSEIKLWPRHRVDAVKSKIWKIDLCKVTPRCHLGQRLSNRDINQKIYPRFSIRTSLWSKG